MAKIKREELTKEMVEKAMKCKDADELIKLANAEGYEITKEEAEAYRNDILASVERFNSEGTWPFRLSVSCGYITSEEGEHKPLADYIKEADNLMYETKKKMHSEKHE